MKINLKVIFICGILIIILPVTGFPDSWKMFFSIIIGLIVSLNAYIIHRSGQPKMKSGAVGSEKATVTEAFVESGK